MQIRRVHIGQGLRWITQAIDIGGRNPRAVFGAAAVSLILMLVLTVALMLPVTIMLLRENAAAPNMMLMLLAMMAPLALIVPVLLGGVMHVIRESETGRPVRIRGLFHPWRSGRAWPLAMLGALWLALALLGSVLVGILAGADYWREYLTVMQQVMTGRMPTVMPAPEHPILLFIVQSVLNYFYYAVLLYSIPLVLFDRIGFWSAVRLGLRAAVSNIAANLLAGALFVLGMIVASLIMLLLAALLALLGSALHPVVGTLLTQLLLLAFASAALVMVIGAGYLAWRDVFGDTTAASSGSSGVIAA